MNLRDVLERLRRSGSQKNIDGMRRFAVASDHAFGVPAPVIRKLAKEIGIDHSLSLRLWNSGFHEARLLAALTADPERCTAAMMDRWVSEIQNWAQCDCCCSELFQKTRFARQLPARWGKRTNEFVRRAGIVMIAVMAVHHKTAADRVFEEYFPLLIRTSTDERNFVKKAVNWALRQIGKRNLVLQQKAIAVAEEIYQIPAPSSHWIAADALREFRDPKTIQMIKKRK